MAEIQWTKEWTAADDGTVVTGADLGNIQDDIGSGITTDAVSIHGVAVEAPTVGDDDKILFYDHSNLKFDYVTQGTFIYGLPLDAPVAGDDGKAIVYDHGNQKFTYSDVIPTGMIMLWSGSIATIPTGWALCDGNNGTPNLTDRFVLHADADSGGTNDVGDTGGASTHTLITAEMPSHSHTYLKYGGSGGGGAPSSGSDSEQFTVTSTSSAGSDTAHNNRDKYYALAYIMKT
jgi:microcystin-dependent protein